MAVPLVSLRTHLKNGYPPKTTSTLAGTPDTYDASESSQLACLLKRSKQLFNAQKVKHPSKLKLDAAHSCQQINLD